MMIQDSGARIQNSGASAGRIEKRFNVKLQKSQERSQNDEKIPFVDRVSYLLNSES